MRDAAYQLVKTDVSQLKGEYRRKGIAARTVDRIRDGASDVYDEAVDVTSDHRGVLTALLAALGLWFVRHPILKALGLEERDDEYDDYQDA